MFSLVLVAGQFLDWMFGAKLVLEQSKAQLLSEKSSCVKLSRFQFRGRSGEKEPGSSVQRGCLALCGLVVAGKCASSGRIAKRPICTITACLL